MEQFTQLIGQLVDWHVPETALVLAIVLVLIDYIFPTDWPCQVGYFLAGVAAFFIVPMGPILSLVAAIAVWILLALGHFFLFGHFLKNKEELETPTPENPPVQET